MVPICSSNGMCKSQVQEENKTSGYFFLKHPLPSAASWIPSMAGEFRTVSTKRRTYWPPQCDSA